MKGIKKKDIHTKFKYKMIKRFEIKQLLKLVKNREILKRTVNKVIKVKK